ncbi:MAG: Lrp/AsnC ligand binding domain-containing protein [Myxococcales bacterium]|nr:Lrp/AsnC ligand binding domain-containing protein [Myxococcales bacterium]
MQTAIAPADQVLLQRLQSEVGPDLAMLAADLGWTLPQLQQRIQYYEEQGWLRGFHGHLIGRSLGLDITAFVMLSCQRSAQWDEISALTLTEDEVQECHTLGGEWSHLLKVCTSSTASLDQLVRRFQEWPGVVRTQSFVAMSTAKETPVLPLAMLPAFSQPAPQQALSKAAAVSTRAMNSQPPSTPAKAPQQASPAAPAVKSVPAAPASGKATSFYPAASASRVAVQEPAPPPQTASSVSMAALPALPPLSASSAGLPAMLAFPPLSSPMSMPGISDASSPSATFPAAVTSHPAQPLPVKVEIPSIKQATTPAKETKADAPKAEAPAAKQEPKAPATTEAAKAVVASDPLPPRDPLASVSAAVDVLLPSIEIDVINELDIATRNASNPQNANVISSPANETKVEEKVSEASSVKSEEPSSTDSASKAAEEKVSASDPKSNEKATASTEVKEEIVVVAEASEKVASAKEASAVESPASEKAEDAKEKVEDKSSTKSFSDRLALLKRKRQVAQQEDVAVAVAVATSEPIEMVDATLKQEEPAASTESAPLVEDVSDKAVEMTTHVVEAPMKIESPPDYVAMSSASMEVAAVDMTLHSDHPASVDEGDVYLSESTHSAGSLDEQLDSLPSHQGDDVDDQEPGTLVASAPQVPAQGPASVDSTNPGTPLSALRSVWLHEPLQKIDEETDEDPTFEVMIETLEVDELRMVEVLGTVKRMFWSKLRDLSRQCSNENVIAFLHSLDLSPVRMAIRETSQEVVEAIADVYAQRLDEVADARQLDVSVQVQYILDQERRERILGDIRTPFREFVERLERLDQARDEMLLLLNDQISAQLSQQKPLLAAELLGKLGSFEEPGGIEMAWSLWLEALKRAMTLYQEEAPEESAQLVEAMEQFISQFEPTYSAILNRILEIWTDKLLPPLEDLMAQV